MSRAWFALVPAFLAIACSDSTDPVAVAQVGLNRTSAQIPIGDSVQIVATTRDADGNVLTDRPVTFTSANGSVASVSNAGWVKALTAGNSTIHVSSESITSDVQITVTAPVVDVELNTLDVQLAIGSSILITATPRDYNGDPLSGRVVTWSTGDPSVATVSSTGEITGEGVGNTVVTATSESIEAEVQVEVTASSILVVSSITPAVLTPDVAAVITGTGFSPTAAQNTVTINGIAVGVTAATSTQLTVTLPGANQFPCAATHNASISITANGETGITQHPLRVATPQTLNAGESIMFASTAQASCNEFAQSGGRYLVVVHRPDGATGSTAPFQLKGEAATVTVPRVIPPIDLPRTSIPAGAPSGMLSPFAMVDLSRRAERARKHREILEENLNQFRGRLDLARRRATRTPEQMLARARASFNIATVGDTTTIKIPNRNLSGNTCTQPPLTVRARTVYSGSRAIILEDVASPLAGTIDSYYEDLGEEFDNVMYPLVTANFGDPLAVDDELDNNGKLLMLFSEEINDFGGILGFVFSCDFADTLVEPTKVASNQAEIFYAIVPDEAGAGFTNNATNTRDEWRRIIRGTLIHEAKHLAMFAETFANPAASSFEDSWLEEGTAMHAEEMFSRTITGATWKGNTGYGSQASPNHIYCEVRPSFAQCADRPFVMGSHFGFLYDYLAEIENRTLLGATPGIANEASFYGSGWAFVRWMIDAYAPNESAVLQAITKEPSLLGTANLTARSGIPFDIMLPQFHYALQYDDIAGITPAAPWQHIASWNMRDIYAGLNADFGPSFAPDPLLDHALAFGNFSVNVNSMRGGTAAHFEISGSQSAAQLIALQAQNGSAPDPRLRMSVFRVQ